MDALLWLGSGEAASQMVSVSASTISRASRKVATEFGLELVKGQGEYTLFGDIRHLDLERLVHQRLRWDRDGQLRIEAQYYSGPLLTEGIGSHYLLGNFDFLDIRKPIALLKSGVIDAWVAGYPDVPPPDDPFLCSFDLTRLPLRLVVSPAHPLLRLGQSVSLRDVAHYPCIALADGAFPESQKRLEARGLWNTPARIRRYNKDSWLGLTSDQVTVGYASVFSIKLFPEPMVFLPLDLNFEVGETLVVKREFVGHPRLDALLVFLKERATDLARQYEEVSLAF